MTRRKLEHYQFSAQAANVIEAGKPLYTQIKGHWNQLYFENNKPIIVELACGKGEYTVGLGKQFPEKNFIGMDIKGDRIARGSLVATEHGLTNVAFLRAGIQYADEFFDESELSEIWLIHPDPQVRDRDENKRLTNPTFLSRYARYLKPGGMFYLKTDSTFLYEYTLEKLSESDQFKLIEHTDHLYESPLHDEHYGVKTHYEGIFVSKGYTIKYIKAVVL
ncbi:tRNA (guanosine(46)-N7)-methyltransferase TrmB [Dyadobacter fanqingshengii]|uniref:tRNA (guanine-N(7)-)-methyltransferase n=1 Tax=Dyadobacter fanqingshengii TaxID=2906443 RepID=A0A9X1PBQ4_9BACT|nr:tRNA (guanosine(46)-N7)-methyltransferase TrmB [Dyadobacter fanqingshengii]MCF0040978.1 tRNA (guanosine(46)-N7)-methyltransferase TrmB [Dyadobacter fanqingshengii]MCF2505918.1 tRNA (guanosine(46)-N7)-methyltransferase TrmB [Dyadobacter fanqingshengii]USJ37291.1 tRNA (guanosine(46)-N7)-methyltransferase TrmB [Dyadobacter fanqingshengii]